MAVTILIRNEFAMAAQKGDLSAPEMTDIKSHVDQGAKLEHALESSRWQVFVLKGLKKDQEEKLVSALQGNKSIEKAYIAPGRSF